MDQKYTKTRVLLECAILIALGTILAQFKIYELPSGGSVTLCSMLPLIIVSYRHGVKWGLLAGFVNSLLQMLLGGIYAPPAGTAVAYIGMFLLDYILAYSATGLAGLFGRDGKLMQVVSGIFVVCFLRFLCSFLSGFLLWASIAEEGWGAVIYSLGYNGSYMLPETILTLFVSVILLKVYSPLFQRQSG